MCSPLSDADLELIRRAEARFDALPPEQRRLIEAAVQFGQRAVDAALNPPDVGPSIIPELSEEEEDADLHRGRLLHRLQKRCDELYRQKLQRHPACGLKGALHLSRPSALGGVESVLFRPRCGRIDCPCCQRRRLCRTLKRAASCVLTGDGATYLPRTEPLFLLETTLARWPALDRAIRRKHGGKTGRLRVIRSDGSVLVVMEQPYPGAEPFAPHLVWDIVEAAIDELAPKRHAYRQLGRWSDAVRSGWKLVQRTSEFVNFASAKGYIDGMGHKGRLFRTSELQGLIFRTGTQAEANTLVGAIVAAAHPTASVSEYLPSSLEVLGESRTATGEPTPPDDPPIDFPRSEEREPSRWAMA